MSVLKTAATVLAASAATTICVYGVFILTPDTTDKQHQSVVELNNIRTENRDLSTTLITTVRNSETIHEDLHAAITDLQTFQGVVE